LSSDFHSKEAEMLRDLQGCELELDTLKSKKSVLEH
jgi:hypothetical protein